MDREVRRRLKHAKVDNGCLSATSISVLSCECQPHSVWVRLHAADGTIFAVAVLPKDLGDELSSRMALCAARPGMTFTDMHDSPGRC